MLATVDRKRAFCGVSVRHRIPYSVHFHSPSWPFRPGRGLICVATYIIAHNTITCKPFLLFYRTKKKKKKKKKRFHYIYAIACETFSACAHVIHLSWHVWHTGSGSSRPGRRHRHARWLSGHRLPCPPACQEQKPPSRWWFSIRGPRPGRNRPLAGTEQKPPLSRHVAKTPA